MRITLRGLKQVPRVFDEYTIQMRKGMSEGLMPPRILLEKVVEQSNGLAMKTPEDSSVRSRSRSFRSRLRRRTRKRLREAGLAAIGERRCNRHM